ncbi:hypothetical protein ERICI_04329 [Paenibacillus larvae subsp. larvae]|uniref:Uncharacterized protein n=3 Tax=Paenibacillus larvae TaxID=1464 RepID=V9W2B3_9BACL|nr:hypothetical protein ERIC2_c02331 [Paenibacillus larvae subsp. larvae DSM 25430]AQR78912.1 hypothetical protein BXP28_18305 [Paenibacillus larvae subsp. larvae]ARF68575.1 hypothetical protein B7C51_13370 [Paenibacillus larvae subsp. pulvifaciens]ETK29304.1 hypothetical protein ERIC1_1c28440 [Paenibacillus larvae subsp. larvae DSM 25719]AVF24023.1 hypothetical protein ERICI_04329 [Paenibacillus larvae subsp. larvae]
MNIFYYGKNPVPILAPGFTYIGRKEGTVLVQSVCCMKGIIGGFAYPKPLTVSLFGFRSRNLV